MTDSQNDVLSQTLSQKCQQQVNDSGRIRVSKKAWMVRIITIVSTLALILYTIHLGITLQDPFVLAGIIVPAHSLAYLVIGWLLFKSPATGTPGNDLVSVIVPVYNQKGMIELVIDAIYRSTYRNIEVIAVNDGSKDGTAEILNGLVKKYPTLKVIHKKNEGKRKAVASAFYNSRGNYLVLIDSDSVVDAQAITEVMKAFKADQRIGGVVGFAKVWNANKNVLTRCQDV
ncbi:MAG: glycosyltransferase family 2 protein, partial [Nitrososphaera sp.]